MLATHQPLLSDMVSSTGIMDETSVLPARSKSKRTRSSTTSRESSRRDHSLRPPSSNSSTSHATRPKLAGTRTASAPLVPLSRDLNLRRIGDESNALNQRAPAASLKDDPFFGNSPPPPQSVTLARELRSAASSERLYNETVSNDPSPRSETRPSTDDSVNLPV